MDRALTISLAVDPALIKAAEVKGVDLEDLFERALKRALTPIQVADENWLRENEAAFKAMNEHVERHGLLSDRYKVD